MFAVPGWSVSASSLVQEQMLTKQKDGKQNNNQSSATSSKKRKRNIPPSGSEAGRTGADGYPNGPERGIKSLKSKAATETKAQSRAKPSPNENVNDLYERVEEKDLSKQSRGNKRGIEPKTVKQKNSKAHISDQENDPETKITAASTTQLTALQAKMRSKLTSARFRHLNETLYTTTSSEALNLFTSSPELFADYHAGFAQQVKDCWPQNPVDMYIRVIRSRGSVSDSRRGLPPLPRRKTGSCTIADLGCGDAPLARGCQATVKSLNLRFHNYDLHAVNAFITKADMANLPLRDGEADIAVFCLSLMGTNWIDFVEEAWRILRGDGKGEVWVAEVKSRFGRVTKGRVVDNSVGKRRKKPKTIKDDGENGYDEPEQFVEDERAQLDADDETDVSAFIKVFTRRGFQLRNGSINKQNKMFVNMVFTKSGIPTAGKHEGLRWSGKGYQKQRDGRTSRASGQSTDEGVTPEQEAKVLKPCVYKPR